MFIYKKIQLKKVSFGNNESCLENHGPTRSLDVVKQYYSTETSFVGDPFCSIDLSGFKIGERIVVTPCKHIFHYGCLAEWIGRNSSGQPNCPNCNYSLKDFRIG